MLLPALRRNTPDQRPALLRRRLHAAFFSIGIGRNTHSDHLSQFSEFIVACSPENVNVVRASLSRIMQSFLPKGVDKRRHGQQIMRKASSAAAYESHFSAMSESVVVRSFTPIKTFRSV